MIIREQIEISAPLQVVWQVFSTFEEWGTWNTVCEECCLLEGSEMTAGTCFSFQLRPYFIPLKITPRILQCDPMKEVIWAGERLGVKAVHTFRFEDKAGRTILTSIEEFRGVMFQLSRMILVPQRLHRLSRQMMQNIRRQAESCQRPNPIQ